MTKNTKRKLTVGAVLGAMGPGLLAALSGNDAGGIATYSSAGASYGYGMLWMLPVMTLLLIVVQETAARCGCVTGKGLASLIREKFGVRRSVLAMAALLVANTAVTIHGRREASPETTSRLRAPRCAAIPRCRILRAPSRMPSRLRAVRSPMSRSA